ncbi:MAG: YihY/virulence factor BrkB family protein [Muribaculaceae bacterium]
MNIKRLYRKVLHWGKEQVQYCSKGVWHDTRRHWWVNLIKTLNLSVQSFLSRDVQSQAMAMAYRTLLAMVPALALFFAIGRGFGLQNVLRNELYRLLPAQQTAIDYALEYVDKYLSQSSEGIFVGVGIVVLLWTLISLMSGVETAFNRIWGVKSGRNLGRKLSEYTALMLLLPVVLMVAGGLSLAVSDSLQSLMGYSFLSPIISIIVEVSSWIMTWFFFALVYFLIPNTKVKFGNAFAAGVFAGTAFLILQWLFVSGQMYVSRYNAIYGSVAFLPLLLIWLQFTYTITLAGAVVCYSSQNIFMFNFSDAIQHMSTSYRNRLSLAITAVVYQRFSTNQGPTELQMLVGRYGIPYRLATIVCDRLIAAGLFIQVDTQDTHKERTFQPALNPNDLTVAQVLKRLNALGAADFIADFDKNFTGVVHCCDAIDQTIAAQAATQLITQLQIQTN